MIPSICLIYLKLRAGRPLWGTLVAGGLWRAVQYHGEKAKAALRPVAGDIAGQSDRRNGHRLGESASCKRSAMLWRDAILFMGWWSWRLIGQLEWIPMALRRRASNHLRALVLGGPIFLHTIVARLPSFS